MLNAEQIDNIIPTIRARMPKIAAALSELTRETWTPTETNHDNTWHIPDLVRPADGCKLTVWLNRNGKTPSLEVRAGTPKYTDGNTYYIRDADKVAPINIGLQKSDEQIAKDIERRILTHWHPVYLAARQEIEAHAGACYIARFDAELVAKALGGEIDEKWNGSHSHEPGQPRTSYEVKKFPTRAGMGAYPSVKVQERTVSFSLTLPIADAIKLLTELPIKDKE